MARRKKKPQNIRKRPRPVDLTFAEVVAFEPDWKGDSPFPSGFAAANEKKASTKARVILDNPYINQFVNRVDEIYGFSGAVPGSKLLGCYPIQRWLDNKFDDTDDWILSLRVEATFRLKALNRLAKNNPGIVVGDMEISGSWLQIEFRAGQEAAS